MAFPTTDEVRAWCSLARTSLSDEQLQQVIDAELQNQGAYCRMPRLPDNVPDPDGYPPMLAQALYRRVGREVASRGVPLGLIGDPASEAGMQRLAQFDAEIERIEGPARLVVFG